MNRYWQFRIAMLAMQQALFATMIVLWTPRNDFGPVLSLTWVTVAALTAAILVAAARHEFIAAIVNGLLAAGLVVLIWAIFGVNQFDIPDVKTAAVGYLIGSLIPSAIAGSYVHVIAAAVRHSHVTSHRDCVRVALKKGLTFSSICVAISIPVLWWLLPGPAAGRLCVPAVPKWLVVAAYASVSLIVGVTTAVLVVMAGVRPDKNTDLQLRDVS